MLDQSVSITGQFDKVSFDQWKATVSEMIGGNVDEKLTLKSVEQIEINPLDVESIQTVDLFTFPKKVSIVSHQFQAAKSDIDATVIHNAGASIIQEVSFIFEQFTKLLDQESIQIHLSCDSMYFSNIAKLRAIRFGLERIIEESKSKVNFKINAHNSLREQTLFDPWVNMLRSTASSMAAIIGGADAVSTFSYDHFYSTLAGTDESDLGRRQADNILKILIEESHLDRIVDPMKGSYSVDNLTYQILTHAWQKYSSGIKLEVLKEEIKEVALKRYALAQTRKQTITGVNNFANPDETLQSIYKTDKKIELQQTGDFPIRSLGYEFEKLRLSLIKKPVIQIAAFGSEAKLSARMNFCKNYFELLGVNVLTSKATKDIASLVDQFKEVQADCVILCAEDSDYPEFAQKMIDQFKAAGAKQIFLAGRPNDLELAGLTNNLYMGQNVFDVLSQFVKEVQ